MGATCIAFNRGKYGVLALLLQAWGAQKTIAPRTQAFIVASEQGSHYKADGTF